MGEYKEVKKPKEFAAAVSREDKVFKNFECSVYDELILSWSPTSTLIVEWEYANRVEGSHSIFPGMFKPDMFTEELWSFYKEVKELLENG